MLAGDKLRFSTDFFFFFDSSACFNKKSILTFKFQLKTLETALSLFLYFVSMAAFCTTSLSLSLSFSHTESSFRLSEGLSC